MAKKKNKEARNKDMYEFANDQLGENKDPSYNPINNNKEKNKKKKNNKARWELYPHLVLFKNKKRKSP